MCFQLTVKVHLHKIGKEPFFLNSEKKIYQCVAGCILLEFYFFSIELTIEKSQYVIGATVKLLYEDSATECK